MAASWISWASVSLAAISGTELILACPMMMESHWTWPKHLALPTTQGRNTWEDSS